MIQRYNPLLARQHFINSINDLKSLNRLGIHVDTLEFTSAFFEDIGNQRLLIPLSQLEGKIDQIKTIVFKKGVVLSNVHFKFRDCLPALDRIVYSTAHDCVGMIPVFSPKIEHPFIKSIDFVDNGRIWIQDCFMFTEGLERVGFCDESIRILGHSTFFMCPSLQEIELPKGLEYIHMSAVGPSSNLSINKHRLASEPKLFGADSDLIPLSTFNMPGGIDFLDDQKDELVQ